MDINPHTNEINIKIVYYGPGLSGKTSNLEVIHQKTPENHRGKLTTLATEQDRTLFFDYMPLELGRVGNLQVRLRLFTVPGQVYYNSTRKLVLRCVDGVVFVADSQTDKREENLESLENLYTNLKEYNISLEEIPLVFQFNKRDLPNISSIDKLNDHLNSFNAPFFPAVAITGDGVFQCLRTVANLAINGVENSFMKRKAKSRPSQKVASLPPIPNLREEKKSPVLEKESRPSAFSAPLGNRFSNPKKLTERIAKKPLVGEKDGGVRKSLSPTPSSGVSTLKSPSTPPLGVKKDEDSTKDLSRGVGENIRRETLHPNVIRSRPAPQKNVKPLHPNVIKLSNDTKRRINNERINNPISERLPKSITPTPQDSRGFSHNPISERLSKSSIPHNPISERLSKSSIPTPQDSRGFSHNPISERLPKSSIPHNPISERLPKSSIPHNPISERLPKSSVPNTRGKLPISFGSKSTAKAPEHRVDTSTKSRVDNSVKPADETGGLKARIKNLKKYREIFGDES